MKQTWVVFDASSVEGRCATSSKTSSKNIKNWHSEWLQEHFPLQWNGSWKSTCLKGSVTKNFVKCCSIMFCYNSRQPCRDVYFYVLIVKKERACIWGQHLKLLLRDPRCPGPLLCRLTITVTARACKSIFFSAGWMRRAEAGRNLTTPGHRRITNNFHIYGTNVFALDQTAI